MKGIAPNLEKIGSMISSKTGSSAPPDKFGKKKKKHLNFNFMKSKK